MFTLITLLLIQFFFCLFFFLYFRHKISEQLKLKDFRQEIDELIISFNRQAERHISYLENLLDNDVFKDNTDVKVRPITHLNIPSKSKFDERISDIDFNSSKIKSNPVSQKPFSSKMKIPIPPQVAHSFYAKFSGSTSTRFSEPSTSIINKSEKIEKSVIYELQKKIIHLNNKGFNSIQIAKKLSISIAEVKLILELKDRN